MSDIDPTLLHRLQFAANISFHILFPTITISLAWVLLFLKWRFHRTGSEHWMDAYRFWVKVFALSFALGVVSGITMSFQFGTNWPGFMLKVGNVAGPLLAYEVLTAFFLEASFLGIMLFGLSRVGHRIHTVATALVAIGTSLSAFWILALNSWMQTPTGHEMRPDATGQLVAHVVSWSAVIFNPSFPYRMLHMLVASGITSAFLILGISAYRWLQQQRGTDVQVMLRLGAWMAVLLVPTQMLLGDLHGLNTLRHQPAKLAAMEGIWETTNGADAVLLAWPDAKTRSNHYEVAIPNLASFYLTHDWQGEIKGLNDFPDTHPPVAPVFFAFRIMVGMGVLMLLTGLYAFWRWKPWRRLDPARLDQYPKLLRVLAWMSFSGWIATLAGWYVTEIGRQPWLVTGILRTEDARATIPTPMVLSTLLIYLAVYMFLLIAYIGVIRHLARKQTTVAMPTGATS
ncbi:cytochrome ubiquinol oxidase subunit I [Ahniella affigens]|uniref:Cytochrome ubiquinol oxidase subunit I n=1 Tax=Ahniella affigens TaxID=2021234 RepID=A0A2P1PQ09_9GAMM|nr:cytochrome ubiquinol oxidase subunit I [Ahniella affigens]AVP96912.1 cytochrome ubiquinol oxidase subunit I [Ahniella affigens]